MSQVSPPSLIKHITSRDNVLVKRLGLLSRSASARKQEGFCLLEGVHLAQSYVSKVGALHSLILREHGQLSVAEQALVAAAREVVMLPPAIFDGISTLTTPTGVMALAAIPQGQAPLTRGLVLALDDVQDPGNVGTLIRTAAAAGLQQVWLSPGCAYPWSVKTLRAAQGAHFHVQVLDHMELAAQFAQFSGQRWATLPHGVASVPVTDVYQAQFARDAVLVLSNEGRGLSPSLQSVLTHGISIPMAAGIESLNVAIAGAIAMYAMTKQIFYDSP